ncbi:FAS1 domain-containing protein [Acrodontium crateriforme]|uniref:FAS1 domain-containing protein n=1 Tax=Acrodontium crateriforme TaxID=150365 RepID=A0AAQ3R876_9PEZI|nr:FAS1 domain-containing protein [Acrodontium crateriforme]
MRSQLTLAILPTLASLCTVSSADDTRAPLSYASIPANVYTPPKANTTLTILDLVESRPELSMLLSVMQQPAGFAQAFDTQPTWSFTFFAPSNTAFENLGEYYSTFASTAKGKWWLGNLLTHHYIPNSVLKSTSFSTTASRIQTGNYLFIGAQVVNGATLLNNVSRVTEADIPVTSGVVHIIDTLLDPSAQIFNGDLPRVSQAFIPGSCANPLLSYC